MEPANIKIYCIITNRRGAKTNKPKPRKHEFMSAQIDFAKLKEENCKFSVVSTHHLSELQREIEKRRDQGEFDKEFCQEYMFKFKFAPPSELPNARSLIIVAMPRPPTQATFTWKGKTKSFILPPTYTAYDEKRIHIERLLA
jgi:epoxyqueuosine reductase